MPEDAAVHDIVLDDVHAARGHPIQRSVVHQVGQIAHADDRAARMHAGDGSRHVAVVYECRRRPRRQGRQSDVGIDQHLVGPGRLENVATTPVLGGIVHHLDARAKHFGRHFQLARLQHGQQEILERIDQIETRSLDRHRHRLVQVRLLGAQMLQFLQHAFRLIAHARNIDGDQAIDVSLQEGCLRHRYRPGTPIDPRAERRGRQRVGVDEPAKVALVVRGQEEIGGVRGRRLGELRPAGAGMIQHPLHDRQSSCGGLIEKARSLRAP